MKVESTAHEVLTHLPSDQEGLEFGISVNAKMFSILFSGIYQHTIAAIVREISTNAYDSHVAAGKKHVPFKVTVPNKMHPYLEIEDFGVGMDYDVAKEVYTVMGESTKQDSNDEAGAWGLGSKTPFAYTSQFTVRMRKDGVERIAIGYMDEKGGPRLDFVTNTATDECNGLKVTIPVREEDIKKFRDEASFYLSFFPTKPDIVGADFGLLFDINQDDLSDDNVTYFYPKVTDTYVNISTGRERVYVTSGPVAYPIHLYNLIDDDEFPREVFDLIACNASYSTPLIIKTDIGEVEPVTSREGLRMTDMTVTNVRKRCMRIADDVLRDFNVIANDTSIHVNHRLMMLRNKFGTLVDKVARLNPEADWVKVQGTRLFGRKGRSHWTEPRLAPRRLQVSSHRGKVRTDTISKYIWSYFDEAVKHLDSIKFEEIPEAIKGAKLTILTNLKGHRIRAGVIIDQLKTNSVIYSSTMTKSSANRFSRVIGCAVETIDYDVLHKQDIEERKKNRVRTNATRRKYDSDEVFGSYFHVRLDSEGELTVGHFTGKWATIEAGSSFMIDTSGTSVSLGEYNSMGVDEFQNALTSVLNPEKVKELGGILIFRKNARNMNKLNKNGVPMFADHLEELLLPMYDVTAARIRASIGIPSLMKLKLAAQVGYKLSGAVSDTVLDDILAATASTVNRVSSFYTDMWAVSMKVEKYLTDMIGGFDDFIERHAVLISNSALNHGLRSSKCLEEPTQYIRHATQYLKEIVSNMDGTVADDVVECSDSNEKLVVAWPITA